ncbi:hypothetical protein MMC19_005527 [Ptychographa xylographoides]|nr:hypothetical protein [Ptychographa xylographoides]
MLCIGPLAFVLTLGSLLVTPLLAHPNDHDHLYARGAGVNEYYNLHTRSARPHAHTHDNDEFTTRDLDDVDLKTRNVELEAELARRRPVREFNLRANRRSAESQLDLRIDTRDAHTHAQYLEDLYAREAYTQEDYDLYARNPYDSLLTARGPHAEFDYQGRAVARDTTSAGPQSKALYARRGTFRCPTDMKGLLFWVPSIGLWECPLCKNCFKLVDKSLIPQACPAPVEMPAA